MKAIEQKPEELNIRGLMERRERNFVMIDELDSENWTIDQEIGEKLRSMRIQKGYGLRETARLLKISAPYLQDMEKGQRHIADEYIEKLLKLL